MRFLYFITKIFSMKIQFNPRYLALFLGLSVFIACKKDDAPKPADPVETPEQILFGKIQGRWEADIPPPARTQSGAPVSSKNQEMLRFTSVEFLSDSTFIFTTNGYSDLGHYVVTDSNSVALTGIAEVNDIEFTSSGISFSVKLTSGDWEGRELEATGKKVEAITVAEAKKPLLKNWYLSINGDKGNIYTEYASQYQADKVKRLFTEYGTVFTQYYADTVLVRGKVNYWKWHPSVADAIIEYTDADEIPDNRYFKITALSTSALTIDEYVIEQGLEDPYKVDTYQYSVTAPVATRKK